VGVSPIDFTGFQIMLVELPTALFSGNRGFRNTGLDLLSSHMPLPEIVTPVQ